MLTISTMLACAVGFSACVGPSDGNSTDAGTTSVEQSASEELPENKDTLTFKTLTVEGTKVNGVVSNATTEFSFKDEVEVNGKVKYVVSLDKNGMQTIVTKTVSLELGNNRVYLFEMIDDEIINTYEITIRRLFAFDVTFDTNGGTDVEKQVVEEEGFAIEPQTTREGYTLAGWSYDFATPITYNIKITANWIANTDTKYTVNYYHQNFDDGKYTLHETVGCAGTTDTKATAVIKEYEHFSYVSSKSTVSGNIEGDGSLVLSVYYMRKTYTLSVNPPSTGSITKAGGYQYGAKEVTTTATPHLGYTFVGWYHDEELLSADTTYTFTVDKNVTAKFTLKDEVSNFNLDSTLETCAITGVKDKTVTEIVIPDYVTSIGAYAFKDCSKLTSIELPDGVTSIGGSAFSGCSSLEEITIPFVGGIKKTASDTYQYPFGYIFGTSSYEGGTATEQYYYGSSTSSTTSSTYYIPTSLKKVTVTGGDILYGAFYNCSKLTSITIPDGVTSIGNFVFENCINLQYTIKDGLKYLGNPNNPYLYLAHTETTDITTAVIENACKFIANSAFSSCSSLTSVTIPDGVTSIGESAFKDCSKLTSIEIPDGVTSIGDYAFNNCESLQYTIKNGLKYLGNPNNPYLYLADTETTNITTAVIENACKVIGSSAFYNCSNLTSVVIPDSVTSIGRTAFYGCSSLTSVVIGNGVTSIGSSAFSYCSSLTSVAIPDSVTSIGDGAFYNCRRLTSVVIGNGVTSIGDYAFRDCSSLTSVTIPDSVTSIGKYAFYTCSNLTSVVIGNGVTSIGYGAFYNCFNLTSVTFMDTSTWYRTTDYSAWENKTGGTERAVINPSNNANYLIYYEYYWYKL